MSIYSTQEKLFTNTIVFYKGGEVNFNVIIPAMWKSNCLFTEEIEHNRIKNRNWQEATSWLFTSMTGYLNLEIPDRE